MQEIVNIGAVRDKKVSSMFFLLFGSKITKTIRIIETLCIDIQMEKNQNVLLHQKP